MSVYTESEKSKSKEFYCESLCNREKSFVIIQTQECVDFCDIPSTVSKLCILKFIEETNEKEENDQNINEEKNKNREDEKRTKEIKAQDKLLESVEKGLTSKNFDT